MKTVEEILEKYAEDHTEIDNTTRFCYKDLLQFVPFKKVYPYLEDKVTPAEWGAYYKPLFRHHVIDEIRAYMRFAWQKICTERGIYAFHSIANFRAWLWILEETKLLAFLSNAKNYPCHGAPMLVEICNRFRWKYLDFVNPHQRKIAAIFLIGKRC